MMPIMIAVFGLLLVSQFFLSKNKPNTPAAATQTAQTAKAPEAASTGCHCVQRPNNRRLPAQSP